MKDAFLIDTKQVFSGRNIVADISEIPKLFRD